MLFGYFVEYKGYQGTIEYDYKDNIHYGKLLGIEDFVNYHAENVNDLYEHYKNAINDYIEIKKELSK